MGAATAIAGGMGAVGGLVKSLEGRKMQRSAQDKINRFRWQDLQNPYDAVQVSTLGSDLMRDQANINTASSIDALRSGGARSLASGIGRVQSQNNDVSRRIAANLDEQQKQIDYSKAGFEGKIQDMIENRQANELAGYGQMQNVGLGLKYQGMGNMINAAGTMGQAGLVNSQIQSNSALTNQYNSMLGQGSMNTGMGYGSPNSASLYYGNTNVG